MIVFLATSKILCLQAIINCPGMAARPNPARWTTNGEADGIAQVTASQSTRALRCVVGVVASG